MEPLIDDPVVRQPSDRNGGLFAIAVTVAVVAMVLAGIGVGFGARAIDESKAEAATAGAVTVAVSLEEFTIAPVTVPVGGSLHITNDGTTPHNVSIDDTDLATADLAVGESEHLSVASLAPGTYTMVCTIPGHEDAGMRADLVVTAGGGASTAAGASDHSDMAMDFAAMEQAMVDSMAAFPAATEGTGNPILEPTEVLSDGTLVFDLVAAITPWERAPGDIVDAWTYNGVVPAPSIQLEVGDRMQLRLTNELPIATDLHLHGLNVDLEFDGVAPITQAPIATGETFTYEYTADEVSVAMYHPHFHSQMGLPNGMFGSVFVGHVPLHQGEVVGGVQIPADLVVAQEMPMVLNDSGVIGYSLNGKSFPATAPVVAADGDWVLVHYYNEGNQIHPMHLHRFDQIVVAKDGFPLDHPYLADVVTVAPGERFSVLVHLNKPGTWVWHCHILPHVETDEGMFGMVTAVVVQ